MITVNEYLQLKTRLSNLNCSAKTVKSKERAETIRKNISDVIEQIKCAEAQEDVTTYLSLLKKKQRLQQTIGARKYYKKDVSALESQLCVIMKSIDELKMVPIPEKHVPQYSSQHDSEVNRLEQVIAKIENILTVSTTSENNYYIINLAWTTITDSIMEPVVEFMKMSNYIAMNETSNTISWKFSYDTIEEKSQVKSLQMCASHLLEVMKKQHNQWSTDAEIFGKIQHY